jgi:hypothetical protein
MITIEEAGFGATFNLSSFKIELPGLLPIGDLAAVVALLQSLVIISLVTYCCSRRPDMDYLIYDEQLLDLEGWLEKLKAYMEKYKSNSFN